MLIPAAVSQTVAGFGDNKTTQCKSQISVIDYDEKLREAYAQNLSAVFQAPSAASSNQMLEEVDAIIQLLEHRMTSEALDS